MPFHLRVFLCATSAASLVVLFGFVSHTTADGVNSLTGAFEGIATQQAAIVANVSAWLQGIAVVATLLALLVPVRYRLGAR
jgi:hypothetical protein